MQLKNGCMAVKLMEFVGLCGEVPVSLVRKLPGYYDYNRRLVTKLVREGYFSSFDCVHYSLFEFYWQRRTVHICLQMICHALKKEHPDAVFASGVTNRQMSGVCSQK